MGLFYGWGSTVSRLAPLRGSSLLFTTNSPEIPGSDFIDLGRMKSWVDLGDTRWFWTWDPWIGNPASYPLGQCSVKGAFIIANITNYFSPSPCRKGGRTLRIGFSFTCGIAFHYRFRYDVLSEKNISALSCFGGMYILPSPVFFKVENQWQGVILTIWVFLKARNKIL